MIRSAHRQEILRSAWRISPMSTIPTHNALYLCISEHLTPLGRRASVSLHRPPSRKPKVPPTHTEVQASAPPYCGMQETCTVVVGWNTPRQHALGNAHQPTSRESRLRRSAYGGAIAATPAPTAARPKPAMVATPAAPVLASRPEILPPLLLLLSLAATPLLESTREALFS